jgi:CRP-like cAMP-binding protein
MVSATRLNGRHAVRMCILNYTTTQADVDFVLDFFASTPLPASILEPRDDDPGASESPLLALLSPAGRRELASAADRRRHPAGSLLISRWATDRDLLVLLSGRASVVIDGRTVGTLGPGDFFGEIAASDWGSGYGVVRTADVRADADVELLHVPQHVVSHLTTTQPAFRERILNARAAHLRQT